MHDREEYELKKKAIFDSMSKRGRERILRIGYEEWEPFEEPKDPRDRIFGSASLRAGVLVKQFYEFSGNREESVSMHRELFELCRGLLQDESRSKTILDFCTWYHKNVEVKGEGGEMA
ncbi:MAG: hypothetical protein AAGU11_21715 [Syntrophobacteraceae bacterium]